MAFKVTEDTIQVFCSKNYSESGDGSFQRSAEEFYVSIPGSWTQAFVFVISLWILWFLDFLRISYVFIWVFCVY